MTLRIRKGVLPVSPSPSSRPATSDSASRAESLLRHLALSEASFRSHQLFRQRLAGSGVQPGSCPSDLQARLNALDQDLASEFASLSRERERVWALLYRLDNPRAARLLESFYLSGMTMRAAALSCGYNERYAYRLRDRALSEIGNWV